MLENCIEECYQFCVCGRPGPIQVSEIPFSFICSPSVENSPTNVLEATANIASCSSHNISLVSFLQICSLNRILCSTKHIFLFIKLHPKLITSDYLEKASLKGPSRQIRFAWKWFGSIGRGKTLDLKKMFILPLILYWLLKFLCDPH
jgi:hypothetical protein